MAPYHCVHTLLLGGGGIFDKNGVIWCNLGAPKYIITDLKINNFRKKNQQENLIAIFHSPTNLDEHVSMKMNTYRIDKGGLGG